MNSTANRECACVRACDWQQLGSGEKERKLRWDPGRKETAAAAFWSAAAVVDVRELQLADFLFSAFEGLLGLWKNDRRGKSFEHGRHVFSLSTTTSISEWNHQRQKKAFDDVLRRTRGKSRGIRSAKLALKEGEPLFLLSSRLSLANLALNCLCLSEIWGTQGKNQPRFSFSSTYVPEQN